MGLSILCGHAADPLAGSKGTTGGTMKTKSAIITVWLLSILLIPLVAISTAQSDKAAGAADTGQKTEIESDRLETNSAEKYAEFIGNVRATQGEHRLSSQKLRIYYSGDTASLKEIAPDADEDLKIRKIVAYGDVHIVSEDYTVDTSRAEYEVATQIMTLTGPNSKVTQGKNTLIGSKITLYQADGRVQVDGDSGKRVKVIFFPEGKEADFFKTPKRESSK